MSNATTVCGSGEPAESTSGEDAHLVSSTQEMVESLAIERQARIEPEEKLAKELEEERKNLEEARKKFDEAAQKGEAERQALNQEKQRLQQGGNATYPASSYLSAATLPVP